MFETKSRTIRAIQPVRTAPVPRSRSDAMISNPRGQAGSAWWKDLALPQLPTPLGKPEPEADAEAYEAMGGFAPMLPAWSPQEVKLPAFPPPVVDAASAAAGAIAAIVGTRWWMSCDELRQHFLHEQAALKRMFEVSLIRPCVKDIEKVFPATFWSELGSCAGGPVGPPMDVGLPALCHLAGCVSCGESMEDDWFCVLDRMAKTVLGTFSDECPQLVAPLTSKTSPNCSLYLNRSNIWKASAVEDKKLDSLVATLLGTSRRGSSEPSAGAAANAVWSLRMLLAVAAIRKCPWVTEIVSTKSYQPFTKADMESVNVGPIPNVFTGCYWGVVQVADGNIGLANQWASALC